MLSANLVFFFVSAVLSVDFFLILSVQVRLSATSLSEVALKVWQAPCTLSASVGPASQTELSASAALALCVLWRVRPCVLMSFMREKMRSASEVSTGTNSMKTTKRST